MRINKRTIILSKVRRHIRDICRRYNHLENLEYPDCFKKPDEEIEKKAIKIYNIIKELK